MSKSVKNSKSMGMATRFWGVIHWETIHTTSMGYAYNNPSSKQKADYKRFYTSFGNIIPCGLCRTSYKKFLKELPLTEKVLSSRKRLFVWTCMIHNKVNQKLGCLIFTRKQIESKYKFMENFRASCSKDKLGCKNTIKKINKKTKIIYVKIK